MHKRKSNIELLRVISMIMITMGHLACAWIEDDAVHFTSQQIIRESMIGVTGIGLSCFMLITGYFSKGKYHHNWKGILKIRHTTVFYCLLTLCIGVLVFKAKAGSLMNTLFPIATVQYWYVSLFVLTMLLQPYLSKMLDALTYRHQVILAGFLYLLECLGLVLNRSGLGGGLPILCSSYFGNFIAVFIIGNLLAKTDMEKVQLRRVIVVLVMLASLIIMLPLLFHGIAIKIGNPLIAKVPTQALWQTTPVTVAISVALFILFHKLNIEHNRIINALGKTSLTCYLLTENKNLPGYMYRYFGRLVPHELSVIGWVGAITVGSCAIFLICCCVDMVRIVLFDKLDETVCKYETDCINTMKENRKWDI